jgi:hypothetical protein
MFDQESLRACMFCDLRVEVASEGTGTCVLLFLLFEKMWEYLSVFSDEKRRMRFRVKLQKEMKTVFLRLRRILLCVTLLLQLGFFGVFVIQLSVFCVSLFSIKIAYLLLFLGFTYKV